MKNLNDNRAISKLNDSLGFFAVYCGLIDGTTGSIESALKFPVALKFEKFRKCRAVAVKRVGVTRNHYDFSRT
jgi:hypothetical protein